MDRGGGGGGGGGVCLSSYHLESCLPRFHVFTESRVKRRRSHLLSSFYIKIEMILAEFRPSQSFFLVSVLLISIHQKWGDEENHHHLCHHWHGMVAIRLSSFPPWHFTLICIIHHQHHDHQLFSFSSTYCFEGEYPEKCKRLCKERSERSIRLHDHSMYYFVIWKGSCCNDHSTKSSRRENLKKLLLVSEEKEEGLHHHQEGAQIVCRSCAHITGIT